MVNLFPHRYEPMLASQDNEGFYKAKSLVETTVYSKKSDWLSSIREALAGLSCETPFGARFKEARFADVVLGDILYLNVEGLDILGNGARKCFGTIKAFRVTKHDSTTGRTEINYLTSGPKYDLYSSPNEAASKSSSQSIPHKEL